MIKSVIYVFIAAALAATAVGSPTSQEVSRLFAQAETQMNAATLLLKATR